MKTKTLTIDEYFGFPEGTHAQFVKEKEKEERNVERERKERIKQTRAKTQKR